MTQLHKFFRRNSRPSRSNVVTYAVGGGKGGIGKSFITSNLALYLARRGHKTLLIDLDFGGANAHTYLRVGGKGPSAKDYFSGKASHLGEVICKTPFRNLSLVKGASDWAEVVSLDLKTLNQFFYAAKNLGYDRIVYDLGAGMGAETIEAFLNADIKLAVSTPEPISIENTYNFLKHCFYRSLQKSAKKHGFLDTVNTLLNKKEDYNILKPSDLIFYLQKHYPKLGTLIAKEVLAHQLKIVINQCRSPKDQKVGKSLAHVSRQYFGQDFECLGSLNFDNRVWQSIRSMKPLFMEFPDSETIHDFRRLFSKIENKNNPVYDNKAA